MAKYNKDLEITFVRHAQSWGNISADNKPDYHPDDPPLTPKGLEQAKLLSNRFEKGDLDKIFSSSLVRTAQTVHPTAEKLGLSVKMIPDLMEIETAIKGTDPEIVKELAPTAIPNTGDDTPTGGPLILGMETTDELVKRAERCLDYLFDVCNDGEKILVASHAAFFGYLVRCSLGIKLPETFCWIVENCGIVQIRFRKDDIPILIKAGDVSHLKNTSCEVKK